MRTDDFNYDLPEAFIAQTPVEPRHKSRLCVVPHGAGALEHRHFWRIGDYLKPGDVLVLSKPLGTGIVNTAVKAEMAIGTS